MSTFQQRIQKADSILAPYAVKHSGGLSRVQKEIPDAVRFRFQRDRGRIVHTEEFRRLKSKTQVFVGGGGDHFRTRLTHTLEVAGISRDIARALDVNEDLAECVALAHDLGHPPFGHAGETAINEWMSQFGLHFEHNIQSHRIVTVLANHSSEYLGLNLSKEILEGLLKHSTPHDHPNDTTIVRSPSLEAQLVNLADEIAYTAHDSEDGLNAGLFAKQDIAAIPLAKEAYAIALKRGTSLRGGLIELLTHNLYEETNVRLSLQCIYNLEDVYKAKESCITFSVDMRTQLDALREFLWNTMYNHPEVLSRSHAGQKIIKLLCDYYHTEDHTKITELMTRNSCSKEEAVKDYVAGMTDNYAFLQAEHLGLLSDDLVKILSHKG